MNCTQITADKHPRLTHCLRKLTVRVGHAEHLVQLHEADEVRDLGRREVERPLVREQPALLVARPLARQEGVSALVRVGGEGGRHSALRHHRVLIGQLVAGGRGRGGGGGRAEAELLQHRECESLLALDEVLVSHAALQLPGWAWDGGGVGEA